MASTMGVGVGRLAVSPPRSPTRGTVSDMSIRRPSHLSGSAPPARKNVDRNCDRTCQTDAPVSTQSIRFPVTFYVRVRRFGQRGESLLNRRRAVYHGRRIEGGRCHRLKRLTGEMQDRCCRSATS